MRRGAMPARWIGLLAVAILPILAQGVAPAQSVVINGVPLVTSRTPVTMGGSMLLPMRDVFEALQSEVKWFASEQKVMAIRGQTTIELWLGRTMATINGTPMQLPVAPTLVNGSTYVPLRFPAEAFGGQIEWQAATRTALITIPPLGETPTTPATPTTPTTPTTPEVPVTPPATPQPVLVEGTLVQVIPNPASIVVTTSGTGLAQAIPIGAATVLTRHADGQPAQPATLQQAEAGDYAQASLDANGVAQTVDLTYGEALGFIAGISENSILLKDNKVYGLSPTIRVVDQADRTVALSDVPNGAAVRLRYQPSSRMVYGMKVTMPAQPAVTPTTAKPQIILLGVLNDSPLFKASDVIRVQMQGTPRGVAKASLGDVFHDLPLVEAEEGNYRADFSVPAGVNAANVSLVGNLTVNGVAATPVTSAVLLTVDTALPVIKGMAPADASTIHTQDTTIAARFDTGGGTAINPASVQMLVNGTRAQGLSVAQDGVTYEAHGLALGNVRVQVVAADMARNTTARVWNFTVGPADPIITRAWHDAKTVLTQGNVLSVFMFVREAGGVATYDIGNLRKGLPMKRGGTTLGYFGTYTVAAGDRLEAGTITVHYRDPAGQQANMDIPNKVDINTALPTALKITAPANGSKVGNTIVVSGEAPQASRVRVTITYTALTIVTGQLWQGIVTPNDQGVWTTQGVASSTGLLGKADEYTIKAEQLDATNTVLATVQIKLVK